MIRNSNFRKFDRRQHRINEDIRAKELRVIGADGKQVGILERDKALEMAREQEIDLVEIAEKANPPVAKLIDYSKLLYQLKKKRQEEKKKAAVSITKEIRFGPFIGEHDLEVKLRHAKEFFDNGNKVKFTVRFKGREMGKTNIGADLLNKVIEKLSEVAKVDRELHMEGRQMIMTMSKLK